MLHITHKLKKSLILRIGFGAFAISTSYNTLLADERCSSDYELSGSMVNQFTSVIDSALMNPDLSAKATLARILKQKLEDTTKVISVEGLGNIDPVSFNSENLDISVTPSLENSQQLMESIRNELYKEKVSNDNVGAFVLNRLGIQDLSINELLEVLLNLDLVANDPEMLLRANIFDKSTALPRLMDVIVAISLLSESGPKISGFGSHETPAVGYMISSIESILNTSDDLYLSFIYGILDSTYKKTAASLLLSKNVLKDDIHANLEEISSLLKDIMNKVSELKGESFEGEMIDDFKVMQLTQQINEISDEKLITTLHYFYSILHLNALGYLMKEVAIIKANLSNILEEGGIDVKLAFEKLILERKQSRDALVYANMLKKYGLNTNDPELLYSTIGNKTKTLFDFLVSNSSPDLDIKTLKHAVALGSAEVVEYLLDNYSYENDEDPSISSEEAWNSLILSAIRSKSDETLSHLFDAGMDFSSSEPYELALKLNSEGALAILRENEEHPKTISSKLMYNTALKDDIQKVRMLHRAGFRLDEDQSDIVVKLVKSRSNDILDIVVKSNLDVNYNEGEALLLAIKDHNSEALETLLNNGANPNLRNGALLLEAVITHNPLLVKLVVNHGFDFSSINLNIFDSIRNEIEIKQLTEIDAILFPKEEEAKVDKKWWDSIFDYFKRS